MILMPLLFVLKLYMDLIFLKILKRLLVQVLEPTIFQLKKQLKGIVVFNTPGANANAVKKPLLLPSSCQLVTILGATDRLTLLQETMCPEQVEAGKKQFAGTEISGKTLGVIGLGAIGTVLLMMHVVWE